MGAYGTAIYGTAVYGPGGDGGGATAPGTFTTLGVLSAGLGRDVWLIGQVVPLCWYVTDEDGVPAAPGTVTLTVELDGATPVTVTTASPEVGTITAGFRPTAAGGYTARLTVDGDHAGASVDRWQVIAADPWAVTAAMLRDYLGDTSATDEQIEGAITAERFAQLARCRVDPYTPDLLEALQRRVARNLAARSVPVASFTSFEGGQTATRVPGVDPEVKRLEAPYRRRTVG